MHDKDHALLERIREVRKLESVSRHLLSEGRAGPDRGWRMLPIVSYERKRWFFDERLRQLRNVRNPHDIIDLDEFGVAYFREGKDERAHPLRR
jgi:hypothetical protein